MEYSEKDSIKLKRHLASLSIQHIKRVDGRTLTIFQKHKIFESLKPDEKYEEILPILNDKNHPNRLSCPPGPLFFYLIQKTPPQGNVVNLAEMFLTTNIDIRKASFDYFSNLEDQEIPIMTTKTRTLLKTLNNSLLSSDGLVWRDAAIAIYDAIDEDWYCNYAAVKQCLHRDYIPGIQEFLTPIIRPTIPSVDSVISGAWEASAQKEEMLKIIEVIVEENSEIQIALNKYFFRFGHLPFRDKLSIVNLIDKWQSKYGKLNNIWEAIWLWVNSYTIPLPRYHACVYFISNPNLVPEDKFPELWQEIIEIIHIPTNEDDDLKWTQAWRVFCEIAQHYCYHLEARLPYKNGEIITSQAWWLAVQICKLFSSEKEIVKRLRNETFLPELNLSSRIWQIASPAIKPSSLRYLTLNIHSIFSISLQAILRNNLDLLKTDLMNIEDHKRLEQAISGSILGILPLKIVDDFKKVYACEDSLLDTAKKWLSYVKEDKNKEMINAFISGIEKLILKDNFDNIITKLTDSHLGDQVLIANYLKNLTYTGKINLETVWKVINDPIWREAAFRKSHPYVLQLIFDSLNEIEARYQDKWAYNLPHYYALELEKITEKEKKNHLFACVIYSSLCGDTVSAIQRLLKGDKRHEYVEEVDQWRRRLEDTQKWSPELVKARIRPILAALHI